MNSILYRTGPPLAIHIHALRFIQHVSDVWTTYGICSVKLTFVSCLVYLDVIVIGHTLYNFQKIFEIQEYKSGIQFEEAAIDPEKLRPVCEWPESKNKHEVWSFLGLCVYYISLFHRRIFQHRQAIDQVNGNREKKVNHSKQKLCAPLILSYHRSVNRCKQQRNL